MREVPAKLVGLVAVVSGAVIALGAGMMLPALGGGWFRGAALTAPHAASSRSRAATDSDRAVSTPHPAASQLPPNPPHIPALRLRPAQLSGAVAAAAQAPADADLVLVVESAAELRQSSVGAAAAKFVLEASGMSPTRQAWLTLSEQLGWSESETFDRLLGGRVMLVARGFDDPETARWALTSDITLETDRRLKERLEASQRAIDRGHQILSIEKGKYELTSHRRAGRVAGAGKGNAPPPEERVTIVLGPAGRSELFDEMVNVLARGSDQPLAGREVISAAAGAGESEVLILARLTGSDAAPAPEADRWADFVVLAGGRARKGAVPLDPSREPSEFSSRVIYRDRHQREFNTAITPTSDTIFRQIEPGSLLTVVQAAPVQQILGEAARVLDALRDVPLPEPAQRLLGARQIVSIRESADQPAHLTAVLALETTSTTQLAPLLDGSISRFIGAREQQLGMTRPPPRDFGGRLPGITRLLPLDLPEATPLRLFVPDPLTVAWSFPATAHLPADAGPPGWWLLSITPAPAGFETLPERTHNAVAAMLSGPAPGGDMRRWVWLGSMRPAALERRLPGSLLVPDIGGFRSAMKRFERVRVELSINDAGDIQGDLTLRLAPVAPEGGKPTAASSAVSR